MDNHEEELADLLSVGRNKRNYNASQELPPPMPPLVDRNKRRFHTYKEAEEKTGYSPLPHNVRMLFRQPRLEQKGKDWELARYDAITSTDFGKALKLNPYASLNQLINKKIAYKDDFTGNMYTNHGERYEDCALHAYEKKTGAYVLDFGLLSHWRLFEDMPAEHEGINEKELEWFRHVHSKATAEKYGALTWLKGSPDGVALFRDEKDGSIKTALLEIKCPWNMKRGQIATYYYAQVQLLMYLTDIDECHFVQYQPPDLPFFAEVLDMIVVPRDREWMDAAKTEASFVWDLIQRRRADNNAPSSETVRTGSTDVENLKRVQQMPSIVAPLNEKKQATPLEKPVNLKKLDFIE